MSSPVYSCQSKFGLHLQVVVNLSTSKENALINKQSMTMPYCSPIAVLVIYCLNTIPLKSSPNLKLFLIPSRTLIPLIRTYKKIRLIKLGTNKKTVFLKSRFFTQKKIKHDLRRFFKKGRKYLIHFKTRTAFLSPLKKKNLYITRTKTWSAKPFF